MWVPTIRGVGRIVEISPEDTSDFELLNEPILVQFAFVDIHNRDYLVSWPWILYAAGLSVDQDALDFFVECLGPCLSYCSQHVVGVCDRSWDR